MKINRLPEDVCVGPSVTLTPIELSEAMVSSRLSTWNAKWTRSSCTVTGPLGGEAGQLNQFVTVRDLEEGKLRSSRRRLPLQYLKAEHIRIKPDRLVQITDAHAGVEEFLDSHDTHYKQSAFLNQQSI